MVVNKAAEVAQFDPDPVLDGFFFDLGREGHPGQDGVHRQFGNLKYLSGLNASNHSYTYCRELLSPALSKLVK